MTEIVNKIVEFDKYENQLVEFENEYKDIVYDFDDAEQAEAAKSDKKVISKAVKLLDDTHKTVKAELLTKTRLIDGARKKIKDRFLVIRKGVTDQIEAHESKAIKHAAGLQLKVDEISNHTIFDDLENPAIAEVQARLDSVKAITIDPSFENREPDGHMAKAKAIEFLEGKILVLEKRALEEAELLKQQEEIQAAREEQIRKDASAKAEQEKLKAQEATKKAEADKLAAESKAKDDAKLAAAKAKKNAAVAEKKAEADKLAAVHAEAKRLQDKADKEKAELEAKQSNQKHRASIHAKAKDSFISQGLDNDTATKIVKMIIKGIDNVKITY